MSSDNYFITDLNDAWGRCRDKDSWSHTLSGEPALFAGRGFTAHEHLEDFKLINMNGRLYDPVVGRFLSPDQHVQSPGFSQSYNRYSYCLNNPLKYTDPSGEIWGFVAGLAAVWAGNYAINWMDNTINKGMSPSQAFQQTSFVAGANFSPSNMSVSHNQVDAYNLVGHEATAYKNLSGQIAGFSGMGMHAEPELDMAFGGFVGVSPLANNVAQAGKDNPYQNNHGERVYTMDEFIDYNRGRTRSQIISQRDNGSYSNSQAGGPHMRYVTNPHDGKVLDMRHMLIVGNLFQVFQYSQHDKSAFDKQDFYSNGVGYQMFSIKQLTINLF